jgi:RHS repeat-associated protein
MRERKTVLASIAALPDDLHCLVASERVAGRHSDPMLDFAHTVEVARNDAGQVTEVAALGPTGRTVLQDVAYDSAARVVEVTRPGQGSTQFAYDVVTGLVAKITAPDGTSSAVIERDLVTDAIRTERADRGGVLHHTFFRHDALDRLAKEWTSLAGTASEPRIAYAYAYADASGALATVTTRTRMTAAALREELELATGGGETLALLRRLPAGWSVNELTSHDPASREVSRFVRTALAPTVADGAITLAMLVSGAVERARVHAVDGGGLRASATMGAGVVHDHHSTRAASAEGIVTTHRDGPHDNLRIRTETHDDEGRPIRRIDETGATTTLRYDALGRLVRITLPDGAVQTRRFDGFGRTARIERSGIGARIWHYDAFGRVERIETMDRHGALARTTVITRDAIGRPRNESHILATTGEPRVFHYGYDGVLPGEPTIAGQVGKLTRTRGDRYEERSLYRPDGNLASTTLKVDGWRSVTREYGYYDDGAIASETWIVRDANGIELRRMRRDDRYDAFGRLEVVLVDGAELARMSYDANGELVEARLVDGERVAYRYDAVTRGLSGYTRTRGGRTDETSWTWNGYGQIEREMFGVGDDKRHRTYVYDERGHVAAAYDAFETASYSYDAAGLPMSADDLAGTRAFTRVGDTLDAGGRIYTFDTLGRITHAGTAELRYGPHGALTWVRQGAVTHTFVSDPQGRRVVKLLENTPIEAYVGGATITATSLQIPYRVGGKLVGVLDNGVLRAVTADARGTRLSGNAGALDAATPFGMRTDHVAVSNVIDFADHGYDGDLAAVRMGVRDYDPYLGRFLTPDPLMLDSMDACARSSVDCSLYAYAQNDPLRFVDPTGMSPTAEDLGAMQSTAPAQLSQCLPEPLASPASMSAPDEPLEVDGYQGNPFDTINKVDVDVFVFAGVSVDPVGPAPVKPEGELVALAGVSSQDWGYVEGIAAYGVKAGTENNYVMMMKGAEANSASGKGEIVMLEAGMGPELPYVAGASAFAGQYYTHEGKGHYVGVSGGLLGAHGFVGIGGSISYDGRNFGPFFDWKPTTH